MSDGGMDRRLAALTQPWDDTPRFYPPGSHPATWRMRQQLRKARELKAQGATEIDDFIDYLETRLAEFEGIESERKAQTLAILPTEESK